MQRCQIRRKETASTASRSTWLLNNGSWFYASNRNRERGTPRLLSTRTLTAMKVRPHAREQLLVLALYRSRHCILPTLLFWSRQFVCYPLQLHSLLYMTRSYAFFQGCLWPYPFLDVICALHTWMPHLSFPRYHSENARVNFNKITSTVSACMCKDGHVPFSNLGKWFISCVKPIQCALVFHCISDALLLQAYQLVVFDKSIACSQY